MADLEVNKALSDDDRAACVELRMQVFVIEQQIPRELELDDLEDKTLFFLARYKGEPVGTARLYLPPDDTLVAKAQRVAVLKRARRLGVGRALMEALQDEAARVGRKEMQLGAQISAIPFYERVGYEAYGPEFDDAGIPHRMMRRALV